MSTLNAPEELHRLYPPILTTAHVAELLHCTIGDVQDIVGDSRVGAVEAHLAIDAEYFSCENRRLVLDVDEYPIEARLPKESEGIGDVSDFLNLTTATTGRESCAGVFSVDGQDEATAGRLPE